MKMKNVMLFVLVNILFLAVAINFWLRPAHESLQIARNSTVLTERRYAAVQRMGLEFEYNLLEIEELQHSFLSSYSDFPIGLAEVSSLATENNLRQINFNAAEPTVHHIGNRDRLWEMRVRAEYEGSLQSIQKFLHGLEFTSITATDINFDSQDRTRIVLDFSLFAFD